MKTILFLFGGCSTEYEVSLQSAHAVLQALDRSRYTPLAVGITREGRWLRYGGPLFHLETGDWEAQPDCVPCALSLDRGDLRLLWLDGSGRSEPFDAAFPVLHGKNGEDGTVQGLLELIGAPIIGCGALSSALCMDKDRSHKLAALAGVRVPRGHLFRRGDDAGEIAREAEALGYPLFVKPVRSGSSFGVSRVAAPEHLAAAAEEAFRHDREILLEEAVPGFEVSCAILGSTALTVGAVAEFQVEGGFIDYGEKYADGGTLRIYCPARIPPEKATEIQETAKRIYRCLDCRVFARVDLFLTPWGELVFNEVNTIPGCTPHSCYPGMMQAIGLDFQTLVSRLVELGVEA